MFEVLTKQDLLWQTRGFPKGTVKLFNEQTQKKRPRLNGFVLSNQNTYKFLEKVREDF